MTRYYVIQGSLRKPRAHRIASGIGRAADFIRQGELVPEGIFSEGDLKLLLEQGWIAPVVATIPESEKPIEPVGPWSVDPKSLAGKTLEELLVMVTEVDPNYPVENLTNEGEAIRQLTVEWDPARAQNVPLSFDRTRPEDLAVIRENNAKPAGSREMSDEARAALERAKERAQAPA